MTQIMLLQSIYTIGAIAFELPTGVFADRFGKSKSICLGSLFFSLGLFFYGVSSRFWQFAIAELICSIGSALISGADRAFLHQTLSALHEENDFNKIEGKARGLTQIASIIGSIAGGIIATLSLGFTLIATGFSTLMGFLSDFLFIKFPMKETQKALAHRTCQL